MKNHEWVNAVLLREETKQSLDVRNIAKCNIATFSGGANSVKQRNVMDTVDMLEEFDHKSHLGKDFYDELMLTKRFLNWTSCSPNSFSGNVII